MVEDLIPEPGEAYCPWWTSKSVRISLIYGVIASIWIIASAYANHGLLAACGYGWTIEIVKGLFFVVMTSYVIFRLTRHYGDSIRATNLQHTIERTEFFRSVVVSVSEGKFDLCSQAEIAETTADTDMWEMDLNSQQDLMNIRSIVSTICRDEGLPDTDAMDFASAVGEAAVNSIKHGGGGHAKVGIVDTKLQVVISDKGPGISEVIIPKVAFQNTYSTGKSLGMGFSLMLRYSSNICLATSSKGTTLLLEKEFISGSLEGIIADNLPDTW